MCVDKIKQWGEKCKVRKSYKVAVVFHHHHKSPPLPLPGEKVGEGGEKAVKAKCLRIIMFLLSTPYYR